MKIEDRARDFVRSRFGKPQTAEADFLHETCAVTSAAFAQQESDAAVKAERERIWRDLDDMLGSDTLNQQLNDYIEELRGGQDDEKRS